MKNIEKDDECGQNNISFNIVTSHSQFIHSHEIGGAHWGGYVVHTPA